MTEKINGQGFRPTDVGARRSEAAKPGASTTRSADTSPQQPARADETVSLTQSGKLMAQLAEIVRNAPPVDLARIAAIKDQLANGTYKFDDQRVADQMLRAEREFVS